MDENPALLDHLMISRIFSERSACENSRTRTRPFKLYYEDVKQKKLGRIKGLPKLRQAVRVKVKNTVGIYNKGKRSITMRSPEHPILGFSEHTFFSNIKTKPFINQCSVDGFNQTIDIGSVEKQSKTEEIVKNIDLVFENTVYVAKDTVCSSAISSLLDDMKSVDEDLVQCDALNELLNLDSLDLDENLCDGHATSS